MPRKRKKQAEINASSMADIAFLLLIFFLVTTTMDIDKGILVILPPYSTEEPPPDTPAKKKEVLEILVNSRDQLLVEGKPMDLLDLKAETMKHVDNNGADPDYSTSPKKAIVSLKNDKGTSYGTYLGVYNEVKAGYNELRNVASNQRFGRNFNDLSREDKQVIKDIYPLRLSEAEPEDLSKAGN